MKFQYAISFAVTLLLSLMAQGQTAQTTSGKKWTLQSCIDYALRNNITLRQNDLTVNTNNNNYQQSQYNALPTLTGSATQAYSGGGRSVNPYNNQIVTNQTYRTNNLILSSSVNLFAGGQNTANIQKNKATLEAARADRENQQNTIKLNIVQAYVNILSTQELVNSAKLQLATTNLQVERSSKLVNAGAQAESALLTLKAQQATEEITVITNENTLELNYLTLKQLLQITAEEPFDIENPNVTVPETWTADESSADIYKYAEKSQPVIQAATFRIKSAQYGISAAQGGLFPTLSLSAGYYTNYSSIASNTTYDATVAPVRNSTPTYYYDDGKGSNIPNVYGYSLPASAIKSENVSFKDQFNNNLRSSIQFNLNVPIFSGYSARTTLANAIINRKNAELTRESARNTLRQTIEQAYLNAKLAYRQYIATQKQVSALKESFRVNEQKFNVGTVNSVDYNLSKTNLSKAENDLIRARYDFILKTKVLEFYQGKEMRF